MKKVMFLFVGIALSFTLIAQNNVVGVEWWIAGNTANPTFQEINPEQTVDGAVGLDMSGLSFGQQVVHMRFLDSRGNWSPVYSQNTAILPKGDNSIGIIGCEYWIDGSYQSKQMLKLNKVKSPLDSTLGLDLSGIDNGSHLLSFRFLDNIGNASEIHRYFIRKYPVGNSENLISGYKYWFNDSVETITYIDFDQAQNPVETMVSVSASQFEIGDTVMLSMQFRDLIGNWSGVVVDTFEISQTSALHDFNMSHHTFLLYPNPAVEKVFLEITTEEFDALDIDIIDLSGKPVYHKSIKNVVPGPLKLDISQLPTGFYQVVLNDSENKYVRQLIIK